MVATPKLFFTNFIFLVRHPVAISIVTGPYILLNHPIIIFQMSDIIELILTFSHLTYTMS